MIPAGVAAPRQTVVFPAVMTHSNLQQLCPPSLDIAGSTTSPAAPTPSLVPTSAILNVAKVSAPPVDVDVHTASDLSRCRWTTALSHLRFLFASAYSQCPPRQYVSHPDCSETHRQLTDARATLGRIDQTKEPT